MYLQEQKVAILEKIKKYYGRNTYLFSQEDIEKFSLLILELQEINICLILMDVVDNEEKQ